MLSMFFAHLLSSSMFIFGKLSVRYAYPVFITFIRKLFSGLISYGLYLLFKGKKENLFKVSWFDALLIFLLGFFYSFLKSVFAFWGMQYLPAGRAAFIINLGPFVTAIFSYIFFKEKMTSKKMLGMLFGFIGIGLFFVDTTSDYAGYSIGVISPPEISIALGVVSNSLGLMLMRYLVRVRKISPFFFNFYSMIIGSVLSLIAVGFDHSMWGIHSGLMHHFLILIFIISLLNTFSTNFKAMLLRKYSATLLAFTSFSIPLFVAIFGRFLFDEEITSTFAVSFAIVFVGLYIFYSEELKQGYVVGSSSQQGTK